MDLFDKCRNFTRARELQALGLYPYFVPIAAHDGTEVEVDGRRLIMAGSNNYLGLTHHPEVKQAAAEAVTRFGSSCSGSRFLNGTMELHVELEQQLARFLDREAALCFSTGFQTNLGVISALVGRDDVVYVDREDHASIFDGCRLSFGEIRKFRHDDMADLEAQLRRTAESGRARGQLIIVDGAFSMMGDLPDLRSLVSLARQYGARVMVDEAHSCGVLGARGRGAAEHFGVEDGVDLIVGTFSKSFASLGGFVAGPSTVIDFIKHHARAQIFSAAIPAANAAAALAALRVIEREPELRVRVMRNARRVQKGLAELGLNVGEATTPIVPVIVGDQERMFVLWRALHDAGLFTNPVTGPAVPPGMDLIRTSYMATHTDEQLDRIVGIFDQVGRSLGLIGDGSVPQRLRQHG